MKYYGAIKLSATFFHPYKSCRTPEAGEAPWVGRDIQTLRDDVPTAWVLGAGSYSDGCPSPC